MTIGKKWLFVLFVSLCCASHAQAENWLIGSYCQEFLNKAEGPRDLGYLSVCPSIAASCPPPGDHEYETFTPDVHNCVRAGGTFLDTMQCFKRICKLQ
jgi:hypothetical protein